MSPLYELYAYSKTKLYKVYKEGLGKYKSSKELSTKIPTMALMLDISIDQQCVFTIHNDFPILLLDSFSIVLSATLIVGAIGFIELADFFFG